MKLETFMDQVAEEIAKGKANGAHWVNIDTPKGLNIHEVSAAMTEAYGPNFDMGYEYDITGAVANYFISIWLIDPHSN